jgi:hypothetical protein
MLRTYHLYGLRIMSPWRLPFRCPETREPGLGEATLSEGPASLFSDLAREAGIRPASTKWFDHARFRDGSTYLQWSGLFEFLISPDGRRIACHSLNGASRETFQTYLLGQVLSFALLKQRIEPLHATVVVVDEHAVAFLGDCGYGKSTLGAAFLQAGHRLLTDDLLALTNRDGCFIAHPGLPWIKLFPEIAKALLGSQVTGTPMNPQTPKLVIPLAPQQSSHAAAPLRAIYILRPPATGVPLKRVTITPLSQRRACLELIANTFNPVIVKPDRLTQQFNLAARLAAAVPTKSLSYPKDLSRLPAVVEALQADLTS